MATPLPPNSRLVLDGLMPQQDCAKLQWLLQALAHDGHSPNVLVITFYELACIDPRLLMPLIAARQRVLQAVESAFDREAELYIEWSGLIA